MLKLLKFAVMGAPTLYMKASPLLVWRMLGHEELDEKCIYMGQLNCLILKECHGY